MKAPPPPYGIVGLGLVGGSVAHGLRRHLPGAHIVRAFNAVGSRSMASAHLEPGRVGMPIAGDDAEAVEVASRLIREIGYEPVLIGDLAMGRYLMPGTPLAGERSVEEIKEIAAGLE